MNPFINTEFWLGFAFFVVLGMVIFSPVRQIIQRSISQQKKNIQDKVDQSKIVYKEAQELYKKTLKEFKNPLKNQEITGQINAIKKEFSEKEKAYMENKNQNFQIQKTLLSMQTKNHLRTQLLQKVTFEILNSKRSRHITTQEIQHFVKILHENKDFLNQNL